MMSVLQALFGILVFVVLALPFSSNWRRVNLQAGGLRHRAAVHHLRAAAEGAGHP